MYVTLILLIGGVFLTLGDVIYKYWAGHEHLSLYLIGLALYLVGLVFLVESYKFQNIEVSSALIVLFNIAMLTLVGWAYFHEKIGLFEIAGLLLAGAAILLLEIGGH